MSISWTFQCKQGTVRIRFTKDIPISEQARRAVGGSYVTETDDKSGFKRGYPVDEFTSLPYMTTKVRIEIIPIDVNAAKVTATVPASEAMKIFGGRSPTTETYDEIQRAITPN